MISLTDEQRNYINAPLDQHVYLRACPGSGKTEVVAAMVSKVVKEWTRFPSGIAVLTFSNSATDELKTRLRTYLGEPLAFPHAVSTFDSFVLSRLVANIASKVTEYPGKNGDFRIRILENKADIFRTRNSICDRWISACKYDYDLDSASFIFSTGERTLDVQLNAARISDNVRSDLIETKKRFWKGGFATYGDVDMLALSALKKPQLQAYFARLARRFPVVVVDECQDLSVEQLRIIKKLSALGVKFHFVGDLNQSIYGFRKSNPDRVRALLDELAFTEHALTTNWRSGQAIVDLSSNLLGIERVTGNPEIASLKPRLLEYTNCPSELLPRIIELTRGYERIVVVARGHTTLQRFRKGETFSGTETLALACVAAGSGSLKELKISVNLFAQWLADKLKLQVTRAGPYCPVAVESKLAWRRFVHECLKFLIAGGVANVDLTWTQWASVAKQAIQQIPDQPFALPEIEDELGALRTLSLKAPARQGKQLLSIRLAQGVDQQHSVDQLRYETIHQVKGETHDATVVVSSRQCGVHQSHWQDWLKDPTSEAARFAYVASSRPRHLLIWAVKKLKPAQAEVLTALGFEFA